MSSGPKLFGGGSGTSLSASEFTSGSSIKVGKLLGVMLSSLWLTVVAGWIVVEQVVLAIHVTLLESVARLLERWILAAFTGGAETARLAWGEAFRGAVEASPLFAPVLLSAEILLVAAILSGAARRWAFL